MELLTTKRSKPVSRGILETFSYILACSALRQLLQEVDMQDIRTIWKQRARKYCIVKRRQVYNMAHDIFEYAYF